MDRFSFKTLEINLAIGCKLNCKYCPKDKMVQKYRANNQNAVMKLSLDDFKVVLSHLDRKVVLGFGGSSEPFSNTQCIPMIRYAYDQQYKVSLFTTLTDVTKEELANLRSIPFEHFIVHIPDSDSNSRFIIDDTYMDALKYVVEHIPITYFSCHGSALHPQVRDIVEPYEAPVSYLEHIADRAGNLEIEGLRKYRPKGRIACVWGNGYDVARMSGWNPMVMPDGTVILCCNDYGMKHILGNLITQTMDEIKEGAEYQRIVQGMELEGDDILCRRCAQGTPVATLPAMQLRAAMTDQNHPLRARDARGVIEKLQTATHIAIMGVGELFYRHYFTFLWNEAFQAALFADNNPNLWGKKLTDAGETVQRAEILKDSPGVLVVIFVKNGDAIARQLDAWHIPHINIFEIFDVFNMKLQGAPGE